MTDEIRNFTDDVFRSVKKAIVFDMDGTLYLHLDKDDIELLKQQNVDPVEPTLKEIKNLGFDLYLVSGAEEDFGKMAVDHLKINECVKQKNFGINKPDGLHEILSELKTQYDTVIMFGDSPDKDIAPAKKLELDNYLVEYGNPNGINSLGKILEIIKISLEAIYGHCFYVKKWERFIIETHLASKGQYLSA